jgi:acyl-coenzyme A synthetase/AMP-(fatty) acid ligase
LEHGFQPGDSIAVWLPDSAEKHVTFVAAAKAGLKIVDVDLELTDVQEIRNFLKSSNCKAVYFKPEHGNFHYLNLLRKAVPELYHCKFFYLFRVGVLLLTYLQ